MDESDYAKQQVLVTQHFVGRLVTEHEVHHLISLCQTLTQHQQYQFKLWLLQLKSNVRADKIHP